VKNRLIVVALMGGVLLAGAACDNADKDSTTTAPTSAAATSAAATSAASGGTAPKEACDQAQAAVAKAFSGLTTSAAAAMQGGGNTETAVQAAAKKFGDDLKAAAAGISDPAVKEALTHWTTAVAAEASKIKTLQDVQNLEKIQDAPDVAAADKEMTTLCGE
jgi:hypothetical protein